MSEFQQLLATVRNALEKAAPADDGPVLAEAVLPVAPAARRAELSSRFARELEAVSGHVIDVSSLEEAAAEIERLARAHDVNSVAIGEGSRLKLGEIAAALGRDGLAVTQAGPVPAADRAELRTRLARCEIGIAEAECAIASSGTLAVLADESQPRALTLLPAISVILVDVDRIVADLATALAMLGKETIAGFQLTLITGPSRTADIEKRIVMGVHGPKELYAIVVWPERG
jgi:L-lactate dehydrogenase complex protein LldG